MAATITLCRFRQVQNGKKLNPLQLLRMSTCSLNRTSHDMLESKTISGPGLVICRG
jgi:hypothetical protein